MILPATVFRRISLSPHVDRFPPRRRSRPRMKPSGSGLYANVPISDEERVTVNRFDPPIMDKTAGHRRRDGR